MGDIKRTLGIKKEKVEAAVKVTAGKITGDKKMELQGKVQGVAASVKEKLHTLKK